MVVWAGMATTVISGCGGGKSNNEPTEAIIDDPLWGKLSLLKGVVRTEDFGDKNLFVSTIQQQMVSGNSVKINETNFFEVLVPKDSFQLLILKSPDGNIIGSSIFMPDKPGVINNRNIIDSISTAKSLIFLSIGNFTSNYNHVDALLSQIQYLKTFNNFLDYLKIRLSNKENIETIKKSNEYHKLILRCLSEIFQQNRETTRLLNLNTVGTPASIEVAVASMGTDNKASPATILFKNHGWRYVQVFRRDLDGNTERFTTTIRNDEKLILSNYIAPPKETSWEEIFKLFISQVGKAEEVYDYPNFGSSNSISSSEYWIVGLGENKENLILPSSIDHSEIKLWIITIFRFLIMPSIQNVLNFFGEKLGKIFIEELGAIIGLLIEEFETLGEIRSVILEYSKVKTINESIINGVIDVAIRMMKFLFQEEKFYKIITDNLSANIADILLAKSIQVIFRGVLSGGDVIFAIGNGWVACDAINNLPSYFKIGVIINADKTEIVVN